MSRRGRAPSKSTNSSPRTARRSACPKVRRLISVYPSYLPLICSVRDQTRFLGQSQQAKNNNSPKKHMQESSEKEVRESFCGTTGIFVARLLGKLLSGLNSCKD